ncbi:MAG: ParA family protein [Deltaproteobacteria bacterium]|nr:ParA family protein [Deltaproteobacteria bacterium]
MGHIICIGSQKGGVGKTTTAVNLSAAFAIAEKKTLLIDSDPQGHATIGIGIDNMKVRKTLYHGLIGGAILDELIIDSDIDSLKIIPARMELIRADSELISRPGKERVLRNLLNDLRDRYDYIIIDCPPSLSLLTVNAITAADSLLIPLQCEFYAVEGLGRLLKFFQIFKKGFNPGIEIEGILLTMFTPNEEVSRQIAKDARNNFKDLLFKTVIPRNQHLRESACHGKPLLLRDIKSVGARCYLELAKEIMGEE